MRKWIVSIVIIGMLGFAIYSYIDKKNENPVSDSSNSTTQTDQVSEVSDDVMDDADADEVGLNPGMSAPDFTLETLDGETVSLSDYEGKKVLLNFWATWCPPCRDEMPDMQTFHEEYGDDVAILGVNLTETEANEDNIGAFLDEMGVDFTILKDMDTSVGLIYGAQALPTSYIIDREGKVVNKAVGPLTYDAMVEVFGDIE